MRTQTIDKFVKELKDIPEEKVNSLFDFMEFLKTKNKAESEIKKPNKKTLKAMNDVEKRKNLVKCKDAKDMFKKLGI
jgi:hypothetical protein